MSTTSPRARELTEANFYRAIYSEHQLEEQLVDFWFKPLQPLASPAGADRLAGAILQSETRSVQAKLASFRDPFGATAAHPARLLHRHNWHAVPVAQRVGVCDFKQKPRQRYAASTKIQRA